MGIPIREGCLGLRLGWGPLTLTHLQFASIQLQQLWPVHLPRGKLGGVLLQVEAVQPLAHLLTGPVVDGGERLIQELGRRPRRVRGMMQPVAYTPGRARGQSSLTSSEDWDSV